MSYIQVELDALNKFPHVARAARLTVDVVGYGCLMMWSHCYRERVDTVTSDELAGFFGTPDIGPALSTFGFLEPLERGLWRVKGAGRYTRLSQARSEAGKRGKAAQMAGAVAIAGQLPDSGRASAGQVLGKRRASAGQRPGKAEGNSVLPGQNLALDPRSDISSPTGKRDIGSENAGPVGVPLQPLPPPAGGAAGGTTEPSEEGSANRSSNTKPPKPPRPPKPVEGTPEYAEAVALGDWQLLRWGPYADKPGQEASP